MLHHIPFISTCFISYFPRISYGFFDESPWKSPLKLLAVEARWYTWPLCRRGPISCPPTSARRGAVIFSGIFYGDCGDLMLMNRDLIGDS
jgi:hypothetical protein